MIIASCDYTLGVQFDPKIVDSLVSNKEKYIRYEREKLRFNDSSKFYDGLDTELPESDFFDSIYRNSYFPLKAIDSNKYKLIKVFNWPDKDIYSWVYAVGFRQSGKQSLLGKTLLKKPIKNINGTLIDSNYIKDKHVFVKCWFIKCVPCLAEMPDLNVIVQKYRNRKDILFISFAFNKTEDLKIFLSDRKFEYMVIPTYKIPEIDSFHFTSFPTHLYVKNNKIEKVIGKGDIVSIIEKFDKGR